MGFLCNCLLYLLAFVSIFFLYIIWKLSKGLDYWHNKSVFYLKPAIFFGNIRDLVLIRKSDAEVYQKLYEQLDGNAFGGIYQMNRPTLIIKDPELIKSVLVKDFSHFHDRGFHINEKTNPLSANLFFLSGQRWRKLRVKLTPTFTSGKLKSMFPIITNCCGQMISHLKPSSSNKQVLEMKDIVAKLTTDIIGSCAFGLQLNSMEDPHSKFREFGRKTVEPSVGIRIRLLMMHILPALGKLMRFLKNNELQDFFIGAVRETVSYREKNNVQRNDFLQLLIQLKNKGKLEGETSYSKEDSYLQRSVSDSETSDYTEDNLVFTENLIAAQCFVFFIGGFDTSSHTVSYCLHELAVNPDIQERLRKEVDDILRENGGKCTYEAIQGMKYMDQVVDETLRKYPIVSKLDRVCTKSYKIPGTDVVIDKGVPVIIPAYALHHDSKYFPEPEKFDPERFRDRSKVTWPQFAYLPFGEGPRICIGMRFGLLQTKVTVATLLSKYRFSVSHKTSVPLVFDPKAPALTAKDGIWLQISDRP